MPHCLTPEEDAIGHPDDLDDEIDDLLPADLWFRVRAGDDRTQPSTRTHEP